MNKQLTILAIDDNPDNLTVLKAVIKDVFPGVRYLSALNGKKGLELAASDDPDVILLDIIMPVMDGFEVCRVLKRNKSTQVIPVIFLTSMSNTREVRLKALEVGAEGFLCKPFDETDLLAQIQSMAKIKTGNLLLLEQKEKLEELVEERTHDIEQELILRRKAEDDLIEANKNLNDSRAVLYESEELYRLIMENVSDMISKHSLDGKYTFLSPSCKSILGYEPDELIGVDPYDLFHPESIEMIRNTHKNILQNPDIFYSIYRIRCKDGNYIWFETSNTTIRDKVNNEPIEILCVSRDITKNVDESDLLKQLTVFAEEMMLTGNRQISFKKILENILHISKAKYAALSLIDEKTGTYTTVEIAGLGDKAKKLSKALGFELKGKEWKGYKVNADRLKDYMIACFSSISEVSDNAIPKSLTKAIEKMFNVGEVDVIKINVNDQMIGDITLIMPAGKCCENKSYLQIYSRQIDTFFTRIKAEQNLKESEELFRSVVENSQDAFYRRKVSSNNYDYMSPNVQSVAGLTDKEMMMLSIEQVMSRLHPDDLQALSASFINDFSSGKDYFEIEYRFLDKTNQFRWLWNRSKLMRDESNKPLYVFGTISNITARKKAEEDILYLNYHDQVTGINNRSYFENAVLRMEDEKYLPLTYAIVDINGLKLINDAYGHKTGDSLLKEVAGVLRNVSRSNDIVARTGGSEFVLLLPKTDLRSAEKIISNIKKAIGNVQKDNSVYSVSIGYAIKYDMSNNMDEVFTKAEDEMYKHKLYESTSMRSKTIDIIMNTLYAKSSREMLHSRRVSDICEAVSKSMNLNTGFINQLKLAGLVHDIGKIGVDEQILNAPRRLSDEEFIEIKKHPEIGFRILSAAKEFSELADYVLEHHERWDGKGYPKGLKGEEISLQARIIAVADSYDAMTVDRSYRSGMSDDEAADEIKKCSGTQFDPEISRKFVEKILNRNW